MFGGEQYNTGEMNSLDTIIKSNSKILNESKKQFDLIKEEIKNEKLIFDKRKRDVVSLYSNLSQMSEEERKQKVVQLCDEFELQLRQIEKSSLSDEEKEKQTDLVYNDLNDVINLYENYSQLNEKEKSAVLDKKISEIERESELRKEALLAQKNLEKEKLRKKINSRFSLLVYYDRKYNLSPKYIFDVYQEMTNCTFSDEEFDKMYQDILYECLKNYPQLERIIISFSELEADKERKKVEESQKGLDKIYDLLRRAEYDKDVNLIDEAIDLINKLDSDEKEELLKKAKGLKKKILIELIEKNIEDAEKNLNDNKTEAAIHNVQEGLNNLDKLDDCEEKEKLREKLHELENKMHDFSNDDKTHDYKKPEKKGKNRKLKWQSIVAMAAGIGIGALAHFTLGPVADIVVLGTGIAGKFGINRMKEKMINMKKLDGPVQIDSIEEPKPGLRGKLNKLKNYFKTEEGLKNLSYFLNSAMITSGGLAALSGIKNIIDSNKAQNIANPTPTPNQTVNQNQVTQGGNGFKIGDSVDGYNLTTGNDTALNAGIQGDESLVQNIMNDGNSVIGGKATNANGETVFNIIDKITGKPRAWVTESQLNNLSNNMGGRTI